MPASIEDYALIGDCETAALVSAAGSIDWLCLPRFDSPACLAALLGTPEHGRWQLAPSASEGKTKRSYHPGTMVLETIFDHPEGVVAIVDYMPVRQGMSNASAPANVIRIVYGRRGRVRMRMDLTLRFDYGATVPWVTRLTGEHGIRAVAGPAMAVLRTPVRLHGEDLSTVAEFTVEAGQAVPFVLTYSASHLATPAPLDAFDELARTQRWWTNWSDQCVVGGDWHGPVKRSLLTLKALTYEPTGGIVAAPTTSLPEAPDGVRNWDYRYCWLRDATRTLRALMAAGYYAEAQAWRSWLVRAVAGSPEQAQIMYGVGGERHLWEWELDWLPGYRGARPVRVGNLASTQLQLDVYGEVLDTLFQARRGGLPLEQASWALQRALVEHVASIWTQPDAGIWEVRNGRHQFTFSKVMAWVALDRAIKTVERHDMPAPISRWRRVRAAIHADVMANGVNPARHSFVQRYGGNTCDASLLLLPMVGFIDGKDPRMLGTIRAVEEELQENGLVHRYVASRAPDGLPGQEATFLACSFWLADAYALAGRWNDARNLFERLLLLRNDVGLLAEEYDPVMCRMAGNFPQALSHIALVNTALLLDQHGRLTR
ncbi:glycoside hydrolase family 15 protein [Cupriavidus oxalaticus]|uniref:Glycoside hydrolase 15-related protein n=1 Tax=Cupriavidus oxalaticus TaxID=96344 RepID=A0A375GJ94_9BURK|nr:glycoside hydrolase family 15 protein [Cupriavidus oxalaticus]QRQ85578.1 glycoside hydrolase family 15 protein [Cupriavidus oxalaticus]QRQ90334.1 glycoside hydrolase family 15 protein [Cupriavidus oxalaticus]WQD84846.1 glycoside hydrolase family 15 protein [Cupriavidus oxalaticus]SPC07756.1 Glycoside hydrolase 15-related protein [Cupriavidus oxalaticus]SPC24411.1 Glycoside hydrolase 15-related protein [Cupriavidus oxalaticus]